MGREDRTAPTALEACGIVFGMLAVYVILGVMRYAG